MTCPNTGKKFVFELQCTRSGEGSSGKEPAKTNLIITRERTAKGSPFPYKYYITGVIFRQVSGKKGERFIAEKEKGLFRVVNERNVRCE